MNTEAIRTTMVNYITNQEIAGGALIVRKNGDVVYQNKWGYADIASRKPIEYDAIYRMMSMTKPVIAVGIMKLMEQGKLQLDDPLSKFIPAFKNMQVCEDKRYIFTKGMKMKDILPKLLFFKMNRVKSVPAQRQITIRDLLSHSSGLAQGIVGLIAMMKDKKTRESLAQQADKYAAYVLDFQPGTGTGYSPLAGFDMLAHVIEIASKQPIDTYLKQEIFEPLGMTDTTFTLDDTQKKRLVSVYKRQKETLIDVTGTKDDMDGMLHRGRGYCSGSGGLFSTLSDYDHFTQMLCNGGSYNDVQLLQPETVALIHKEAPKLHLEPDPGFVWGLGMKIRQNPELSGSFASQGTYGWSGAFGTHFFVSPQDKIGAVFMVNRSDLDGAGSYISNKVEELVFGQFANER